MRSFFTDQFCKAHFYQKTKPTLILASVLLVGCNLGDPPADIERDARTGLTETEAVQVLAEVGDVKITLGQYAESLLRMGEYERLRYQSKERQEQLLQEMIDLELFAQEARRLKLNDKPEVQLALDQADRNEVLADLKLSAVKPADIKESEVREYFTQHRSEFQEPERRRVLAIELKTKVSAENILKKALHSDGKSWGILATPYLSLAEKSQELGASEYRGDLGYTSAPEQGVARNLRVPDAVAAAVFQLEKLGDVFPEVVEFEGRFFIVRLGATSPARDRSFNSAAPIIRVELARMKYLETERKLVAELRQRYPVQILP